MARFQGVRERLHSPMYDAFFVPADPTKAFKDFMTDPRMIRFFIDIQNKTRLETNLQASGVLPSLNTFEARAMRVIASSFCLPRDAFNILRKDILAAAEEYCKEWKSQVAAEGGAKSEPSTGSLSSFSKPAEQATQDRLINEIRKSFTTIIGTASVNGHINQAILEAANQFCNNGKPNQLVDAILDAFHAGCKAASGVLPQLIYNSVTTLLVGEKIMIESPTFYFPSGAGVSPGGAEANNHGSPDPMATFRFSEPVIIEPQQNFRVEMLFPQGVPGTLANASGPLRIWVVLDGYLTRDVQ